MGTSGQSRDCCCPKRDILRQVTRQRKPLMVHRPADGSGGVAFRLDLVWIVQPFWSTKRPANNSPACSSSSAHTPGTRRQSE